MNSWKAASTLFLALPLAAAARGAFNGADQGTIIVRVGGKEIGRETFTFRPTASNKSGADSLFMTARYPESNPETILTAGYQRSPITGLALQLDFRSPQGARQVYAATVRGRIAVRSVTPGSESAKEFPSGPKVVILDDSLFTLFIQPARLATRSGEQLVAIYPRSGRRLSFTAKLEPASGNGGDLTRVVLSGGITGTIYLDSQGRLVKIELPTREITAIRLTE